MAVQPADGSRRLSSRLRCGMTVCRGDAHDQYDSAYGSVFDHLAVLVTMEPNSRNFCE
jgi:hypothetical protein